MTREFTSGKRRYVRAHGPFNGHLLGSPKTPVLIYDLNLGGGLVDFTGELPKGSTLLLEIDLPHDGPITVNAETVYREPSGLAVRFVNLAAKTAARLMRAVAATGEPRPSSL
jgi:PilZ domain